MLLTKFHIPAPGNNILSRPELFNLMNQGLHRKLTLIAAPAGYGKTMLISSWIHKNSIAVVWYSINSKDAEVKNFLELLIYATQLKYKSIGNTALETLNSPQDANLDYVIELFINDLLSLEEHFYIVLDDFHLVASADVCEKLAYLINHMPPHVHFIISCRSDPALPVARWRSQQQMVEIRARELNFSTSEIAHYFSKKLNLNLSAGDVSILQQKTEGWIAGIQLTAISMQDKKDISDYLDKLAGDNRYIMDYLMEEVLERQDQETTKFLLSTAFLEQFCAPLCDYMLGKSDSQQVLENMEKRNMFLVSLDDERKWYRYHHLFADLLQIRHKYNGKHELKAIHQKASEWFEQNQMNEEALEHALQAENYQRTLSLLDAGLNTYWYSGKTGEIIRFGKSLPQEHLLENNRVSVYFGWALVILGETENALKILQPLEKKLSPQDKEIAGKLYITYNLLYTFTGDTEKAFYYSDKALQNLSATDLYWNVWAYLSHGEACHCMLEVDKALESWHHSLQISQQLDNAYLTILSHIEIAYSLLLKGKFKQCYQLCQEQIEVIKKSPTAQIGSMEIFSSMFYCMAGYVLAEWNDTKTAIEYGELGFKLSRNTSNISFIGYCDWLLACIYSKTGALDKAQVVLAEIELDKRMTQLLTALGYSLLVKIHLLNDDLTSASQLLNQQSLRHDIINEYETVAVKTARARYYLMNYQLEEALELLKAVEKLTREKGTDEMLIEILLLLSRVHLKKRDKEAAIENLKSGLQLAEKDKYIRSFINEGEDIELLLKEISPGSLSGKEMKNLREVLLAAFEDGRKAPASFADLLSERELDTLKLIALELTNQQIADQLFISLNTVKTHLKNIYLKLESKTRAEAVAKAKALNLL